MYFTGDTVYKFFRAIFAIAVVIFCVLLVRCGWYDETVDYVRALVVYAIGAISYGIMWIARELY